MYTQNHQNCKILNNNSLLNLDNEINFQNEKIFYEGGFQEKEFENN